MSSDSLRMVRYYPPGSTRPEPVRYHPPPGEPWRPWYYPTPRGGLPQRPLRYHPPPGESAARRSSYYPPPQEGQKAALNAKVSPESEDCGCDCGGACATSSRCGGSCQHGPAETLVSRPLSGPLREVSLSRSPSSIGFPVGSLALNFKTTLPCEINNDSEICCVFSRRMYLQQEIRAILW